MEINKNLQINMAEIVSDCFSTNLLKSVTLYMFGDLSKSEMFTLCIDFDSLEVLVVPVDREIVESKYTDVKEAYAKMSQQIIFNEKIDGKTRVPSARLIEIIEGIKKDVPQQDVIWEWYKRTAEWMSSWFTENLKRCASDIGAMRKLIKETY